jgi:hypothetical protein
MQEYSYKIGDLSLRVSNQKIDDSAIDYLKSISGVNKFHPSWEEYLDLMPTDLLIHLHLIKKAILDIGWVGKPASEVTDKWNFYFSDGRILNFTNRAWGEMMSALVNKREGYEEYYH